MTDARIKIAVWIVAGLGMADALYLTWIKLSSQTAACSAAGDCTTVNNSIYADIGGIPIAAFGAGAYLAIILLLYLEERHNVFRENGRWMVYGISLAGVLYSGYLTYIELYVIKAICPFCVFSAVCLVVLLILSGLRLFRPTPSEDDEDSTALHDQSV
jgi:uncharacterized membrane protein